MAETVKCDSTQSDFELRLEERIGQLDQCLTERMQWMHQWRQALAASSRDCSDGEQQACNEDQSSDPSASESSARKQGPSSFQSSAHRYSPNVIEPAFPHSDSSYNPSYQNCHSQNQQRGFLTDIDTNRQLRTINQSNNTQKSDGNEMSLSERSCMNCLKENYVAVGQSKNITNEPSYFYDQTAKSKSREIKATPMTVRSQIQQLRSECRSLAAFAQSQLQAFREQAKEHASSALMAIVSMVAQEVTKRLAESPPPANYSSPSKNSDFEMNTPPKTNKNDDGFALPNEHSNTFNQQKFVLKNLLIPQITKLPPFSSVQVSSRQFAMVSRNSPFCHSYIGQVKSSQVRKPWPTLRHPFLRRSSTTDSEISNFSKGGNNASQESLQWEAHGRGRLYIDGPSYSEEFVLYEGRLSNGWAFGKGKVYWKPAYYIMEGILKQQQVDFNPSLHTPLLAYSGTFENGYAKGEGALVFLLVMNDYFRQACRVRTTIATKVAEERQIASGRWHSGLLLLSLGEATY